MIVSWAERVEKNTKIPGPKECQNICTFQELSVIGVSAYLTAALHSLGPHTTV